MQVLIRENSKYSRKAKISEVHVIEMGVTTLRADNHKVRMARMNSPMYDVSKTFVWGKK